MSCSGLLFAGANSALSPRRNAEIPEGADDGILTAKEISRLDFQGLDMVILSACQTGLGAITGEGVFGLQRGFKKAGAQTIIMSLWSVADESTELLMTEFFKNLTAGQSKRAAFLTAVQTVREKYPNPLYWAAFVMVDAI
jgi:CHAT domain-containing protein